MSKIEWTGHTWNPIVGCSVVSPGCTNCYAMKMAARLERMGTARYAGLTQPSKAGPVWTGKVAFVEEALTLPLKRQKPTTYFVNSMSDLFHDGVPDAWIDRVFAVMALCPQHTFQVLTKRSARMRAYMTAERTPARIALIRARLGAEAKGERPIYIGVNVRRERDLWPLSNVWLGVSAEDQARADESIPDLLATPAAVRFVSAEPLIGPVDFERICIVPQVCGSHRAGIHIDALSGRYVESGLDYIGDWGISGPCPTDWPPLRLDWIIVGGESGHRARAMHPDWARSIRDQCAAAGVAFHFKQWGTWQPRKWCGDGGTHAMRDRSGQISFQQIQSHPNSIERVGAGPEWSAFARVGKARAGRLLDGVEHNGMPAGAP